MRILIACEFSGRVRDAFIQRGHDAVSCDLLDTESPGPHIKGNVLDILNNGYDMMVAFPPCTYLSTVGTAHWNKPGRKELREAAFEFFMKLYNTKIPRICIENPVGYVNSHFRKPDQIIHPYYFADPSNVVDYQYKRTCLWLKQLPKLVHPDPKTIVKPAPHYIDKNGVAKHFIDRASNWQNQAAHTRSIIFQSLADAMAKNWSN